jgi:hypothetical protein
VTIPLTLLPDALESGAGWMPESPRSNANPSGAFRNGAEGGSVPMTASYPRENFRHFPWPPHRSCNAPQGQLDSA